MWPFIAISENIFIPTYMLVVSLTFCLSLLWIYIRAIKQEKDVNTALDLSLALMIGGFIGARLLHVIYEEPHHYLDHPEHIFHFWHGGFVFYGGFIGSLLATYLVVKIKKISFAEWADFFAPVLALGYAFGRIACFLNGCCYGALCDLPWAIEFDHPGLPSGARHPTALYASLWEFGVFTLLITLEKLKNLKRLTYRPGSLFLYWIILHSGGRLLMEAFRDDPRGAEPLGLSVSSWISLGLLLVTAVMLVRRVTKKNS